MNRLVGVPCGSPDPGTSSVRALTEYGLISSIETGTLEAADPELSMWIVVGQVMRKPLILRESDLSLEVVG